MHETSSEHRTFVRHKPGTEPGSVVTDPRAEVTRIRVLAFGKDDYYDRTIEDVQQLADVLKRWPVTWIDVSGLRSAESS